jgi:hypothetical protein
MGYPTPASVAKGTSKHETYHGHGFRVIYGDQNDDAKLS